MTCHCESNCLRLHKKQPDSGGIIDSHTGSTGTPHQASEATVIGDTNNRDFSCDPVCSQQLPLGEVRILSLQLQRVTDAADYVQDHNIVSLMPCGQPTSHSPPRAGRSLPTYIVFSSMLI